MEFIELIKSNLYLNYTARIFIAGSLGVLYVLIASIYSNQKIFRDKEFIFLGFSLPTLGFIITAVIGNNIALSLGMVGALSIIRFRTPVRSSYELVIYFALLTMGISTNVDYRLTIVLFLILTFFKFIYHLYYQKIMSYFFSSKTLSSNNLDANLSFIIDKNELSKFITDKDFQEFSCDALENDKIEINIKKSFKNKEKLEDYIKENNKTIKNIIINDD